MGRVSFISLQCFTPLGRLTEDSSLSSPVRLLPPTPTPPFTCHFEPSITEIGLSFEIYYIIRHSRLCIRLKHPTLIFPSFFRGKRLVRIN